MITPQISSLQWSRQVVPYLKHFSTSTSISHGFYDSHSNTSSTNEAGNIQEQMSTKRSARKEFRSIPVHSSILNAIEAMGVGMRPMQAKSRYLKSVKLTRRKLLKGEDINEKDERNILRNRNSESKMVSLVEPISASPHMWMPLLPFGNILPTHLSRQEGILEQIKVKKLPIKVLGSAGSRNDELPRSTKGIPEIVSETFTCILFLLKWFSHHGYFCIGDCRSLKCGKVYTFKCKYTSLCNFFHFMNILLNPISFRISFFVRHFYMGISFHQHYLKQGNLQGVKLPTVQNSPKVQKLLFQIYRVKQKE